MSEIQPDRATERHGHGVFTVLNSYLGGKKAVERARMKESKHHKMKLVNRSKEVMKLGASVMVKHGRNLFWRRRMRYLESN